MKRMILGILLAFALLVAAPPFASAPSAAAAQPERTLAAACAAYYEVLMAAVNEYGIAPDPNPFDVDYDAAYEEWYKKAYGGLYSGLGVYCAELIYFGDSVLPQLLFIYDSGYGTDGYLSSAMVYGYTSGVALYSSNIDFGDGYLIGGDNPYGQIYVVTGRDGELYLDSAITSIDYENGAGDYIGVDHSYNNYYTVRNNQWVEVAEAQIGIVGKRELVYSPGSVHAAIAELQSLQNAPTPQANTPSDWAREEVGAAMAAALVPDSISGSGWQNPTSRLAAADAIVLLIEKSLGKSMAQIANERGWDLNMNQFLDTNSHAVTFLKYAEVTAGVGGNRYEPNGDYDRAQIVTMIGRTAEAFFGATARGTNPFSDVPDWAAPYVGYAAENGITQGVGGGRFDSYAVLQNQHTAVFCYRAYNAWG